MVNLDRHGRVEVARALFDAWYRPTAMYWPELEVCHVDGNQDNGTLLNLGVALRRFPTIPIPVYAVPLDGFALPASRFTTLQNASCAHDLGPMGTNELVLPLDVAWRMRRRERGYHVVSHAAVELDMLERVLVAQRGAQSNK